MQQSTAKLFATGGSQAVRLPAEFRFEGGGESLYPPATKTRATSSCPRDRPWTGAHSCNCASS